MGTLHFEIGPDAFQTGPPGDVTKATVYFGADPGTASPLGAFTSNPEAGNDGVREWTVFDVAVSASPGTDYRVEFDYATGGAWDTCHIRRVRLFRDDASQRDAEYPKGKTYSSTQLDGIGLSNAEMGECDGGFSVGGVMFDACGAVVVTSPLTPRCVWYFSANPIDPCPPTGTGWSVAGVRL